MQIQNPTNTQNVLQNIVDKLDDLLQIAPECMYDTIYDIIATLEHYESCRD